MEQKQTNVKLQDEAKLAYMIAWRDKRIAALEQLIQAQNEAGSIYAAYIAYLLERCGEQTENQISLTVAKASIREICGKYTVRAEDAGESLVIILENLGESHGAGRSEMADA